MAVGKSGIIIDAAGTRANRALEISVTPSAEPSFTFDRERNVYVCPGGAELTRQATSIRVKSSTTEPARATARAVH
jgi:hypothetical protein